MGEFGAAHQSTLIDPQKAMSSPPEKGRASSINPKHHVKHED